MTFRWRRLNRDIDAELEAYLEMLADRYREEGLPSDQAMIAARKEFEGMARVKEDIRSMHGAGWFDQISQDLRYSIRALRKTPSFTAILLATLIIGIATTTAIFSVVDAALLRPLPYDRPEQLGLIWSTFEKAAANRAPTSGPALREIRQRTRLFQDIGAIWVGTGNFSGTENPEQIKLANVTSNFLQMLGVQPALGGVFTSADEGHPVMVISDALWHRRFGGDPNIIGKSVVFQGGNVKVVGVLRDDFRLYFAPDSNVPAGVEAFLPYGPGLYRGPITLYYLRLAARLKPGVTFAQAQQDLNHAAIEIRAVYGEFAGENLRLEIVPMQADAFRDMRAGLLALLGGAIFVLLICAVNAANLTLARAGARRKELAVRAAIGASTARIFRQLLIEGFLLAAIAGITGAILGRVGAELLLRLRPDAAARIGNVGTSWLSAGLIVAICLGCTLLMGLAPGVESAKSDLIQSLLRAGRPSSGMLRPTLRRTLVVLEIALGLVLVIGSGLMIRTFTNVRQVSPGFMPQHLLTFSVTFPGLRYGKPGAIGSFLDEFNLQLAALPGVEAAGASSHLPLDDYPNWYSAYRPEDTASNQGAPLLADHRSVTPGYFRALRTRLVDGRFFDAQDRANGRQVVIVDDLLASTTWPGRSAIGRKLESEHITSRGFQPIWAEVVGVVEHIRNHSLTQKLRPEIYIPFEQSPRSPLSYAVRTAGDPTALIDPIRQLMRRSDPEMAIAKVRPMSAYVEKAQAPATFTAILAGIFAGVALVLAAIGIYGVLYDSVSRRMPEMGIRMALGASGSDVRRLILREAFILTAIAITVGTAGSLALSRELQSSVYGVSATDPLTYVIAFAVIFTAAAVGCMRPAAKAATANPVDAIRME